jgi:hypothetical protein
MSDETLVCEQCGDPLETALEPIGAEPLLCERCETTVSPDPAPDLRSWLLFGLVAGAVDSGEGSDGGAGGE